MTPVAARRDDINRGVEGRGRRHGPIPRGVVNRSVLRHDRWLSARSSSISHFVRPIRESEDSGKQSS
jgi:hypothetical protein